METLINVLTGMWLREKNETLPSDKQAAQLFRQAILFGKNRQIEDSCQYFLASLALEKSPIVSMHTAILYHFTGQYEKADEYFKQAVTLAPESTTIRYNYAHFLHAQSKFIEAEHHFASIVTNKNNTNKDVVPLALNDMGCINTHNKQLDNALKFFGAANTIRGPLIIPLYNSGVVYAWQGSFEKASIIFKGIINKHPTFEYAYNALGYIYDKQGNSKQAFTYFAKALEIDKNCAIARANNERIQERINKQDKQHNNFGIA